MWVRKRGEHKQAAGCLAIGQAPPEGFCLISEQSGGYGVRGRENPDRDSRNTFGEVPSLGGEGRQMLNALGGAFSLAILAGVERAVQRETLKAFSLSHGKFSPPGCRSDTGAGREKPLP